MLVLYLLWLLAHRNVYGYDSFRRQEKVMYILLYCQLGMYADWRYETVMGILIA